MKLTWQSSLVAVACAGLLGIGAGLTAQERTARPSAARKQAADEVQALACHVNIIDKVTIPAARGGVLGVVNCDVGSVVKANEQVAKVKDEVALAGFKTAHTQATNDIEIKFAEKSADLAEVEYIKAFRTNAVLPNTITDIEMRRLKLSWDKAVLQKQNAEKDHEVAACKRDEAGEILQTHVVTSPISGSVIKLYKRTGDGVREGEAILDVVNTDRMRVAGYVPFKERSRVKVGDAVRVQIVVEGDDLPEEEEVFVGKIVHIDLAVQKVKPEVRVYADVINRNGVLIDGLTCSMTIYPGREASSTATTNQRTVPNKVAGGQ